MSDCPPLFAAIRVAAVAAIAAVTNAQVQTLLAPASAATQDLPTATAQPFDAGPMRVLYVLDSSHFSLGGITGPVLLSGLRVRANAATSQAWVGDTIGDLRVELSTATVDHASIGSVYANNHGVDRTLVRSGALVLVAGSTQAGVPGPFHVDIPFQTPFVYDPALGDLALDLRSSGVPDPARTPQCDATSVPGDARARRVVAVGDPDAVAGTVPAGEHCMVFEFDWQPVSGLRAAFTATPTAGGAPLLVQFTDQSSTSDPGGITAWAWDFDGDGLVDSNQQHPSFLYTACGGYDVTLTVQDGIHAPAVATRVAFVVTDVVAPDFDHVYQGNGTVLFTDTSTPTPDRWEWDFDGDGVADANTATATWTFPSGCRPVPVTLRVGRACRPFVAVTRSLVPTAFLATTLAADGAGTSGYGYFFDATVHHPTGIEVCGLDTVVNGTGASFRVDVFVTEDTWVGRDGDGSRWRLVASGSGAEQGPDRPSFVQLQRPLYLPPGRHGIACYFAGTAPRHWLGGGQPQQFANLELQLDLGALRTGQFIGQQLAPRIFCGALHYRTCAGDGRGSYGFFGAGCAGGRGIPGNLAANECRIGNTLRVDVTGLPLDAGFFLTGFSRTSSGFGTLPLDLQGFGAPGCFGRVSPDATELLLGNNNFATWLLRIPNQPSLLCTQFYTQVLALDPAANALGGVMSDAAAAVIGR